MKIAQERLSRAVSLRCSNCYQEYSLFSVNGFARCCNQPLVVDYDMVLLQKNALSHRTKSMWRYREMLPVQHESNIVTMGEGMTPLFPLTNLGNRYGYPSLMMKDESGNPTGSFKARGMSVAMSKAKEFGITHCIVPTAGNAGGAMAAYGAKAGIKCTVVMPSHTPELFKQECVLYGAELILVDGLISDCAKKVAAINREGKYFDMSTLKEPYRLEGKKTMGYEIAEQLHWSLPDVIIYPAGGGTGLIGIWKAFRELESMGWIKGPLPRMIAVQSDKCSPLIYALEDPINWTSAFTPGPTIANGLAVPYPFGMNMMLQVLHESNGMAVTVSDEEIIAGIKEFARSEGILLSPEGAATWKALNKLAGAGKIEADEKILLLNTGTGYKYLENFTA
jgi:threonine synthase